jgi:hypothetical protein
MCVCNMYLDSVSGIYIWNMYLECVYVICICNVSLEYIHMLVCIICTWLVSFSHVF